MTKAIKEIKEKVSKKIHGVTEQESDEPKNPELEIQKQIRERKENPTVGEKLEQVAFNLTKDLPNFSSKGQQWETKRSREREMKKIRERKDSKQKEQQLSR